MDCCICGPMAAVYRPPRNTICLSCYEAAKRMNTFLNNLQAQESGVVLDPKHPPKSLAEVLNWMEKRRGVEDELNERMGFMESYSMAFTDSMHTDILLEPGNGPSIPAHRALLATKSEILRTLLSSDEYKAPATDSISLPELTHQHLQHLLQFLYTGKLPHDISDDDMYVLLLAADKYNVQYLRSICERRILASLSPDNALDVLEVSEVCSDSSVLRTRAMASVMGHVEDVVFSKRYEDFAAKNALLCVEITRMIARDLKKKDGEHNRE